MKSKADIKKRQFMLPGLSTFLLLFISLSNTYGQSDTGRSSAPRKWYESFSIRGYAQVRYNRLLETNENLGCEQCDRS